MWSARRGELLCELCEEVEAGEMNILGIHDGPNSRATLLVDGEVIASDCEVDAEYLGPCRKSLTA